METRGPETEQSSRRRPPVARRSCDHCRSRKIGCDRVSPCSNCVSAKLQCTYSWVASSSTSTKQRVLISSEYEHKLDGIAKDIDGIKQILSNLRTSSDQEPSDASGPKLLAASSNIIPNSENEGGLLDHSAHILDFLKWVVHEEERKMADTQLGDDLQSCLPSLKELVEALKVPVGNQSIALSTAKVTQAELHMPPLDAVVTILRWAKDHTKNTRIAWIAHVLPLEHFNNICRKVYFAVDDYNEIDFILCCGYLACVFFEHAAMSGRTDYQEYARQSRTNLQDAVSRLPLLLPTTMDVVAAMVLGAYNAIESSRALTAWHLISIAANFSLTLGYHRLPASDEIMSTIQVNQQRLFWTMHKIEKALSHRLGRPSNIRDDEITIALPLESLRQTRLAILQGMAYNQIFSPKGLSSPHDERKHAAERLASQLREIIREAQDEVLDCASQIEMKSDPMRVVYLQCDLICYTSLLCQILRAIPESGSMIGTVSLECLQAARAALALHEQCLQVLCNSNKFPLMETIYVNWAILHCPFVPFSVLYTQAMQLMDVKELDGLERFAASLDSNSGDGKTVTHPQRLYKLLCQAARLSLESGPAFQLQGSVQIPNSAGTANSLDLEPFIFEDMALLGADLGAEEAQEREFRAWYHDNQHIMNILDENTIL